MIKTNLVQRNQGVELHDSKVVAERDKRRDIDDVLGAMPEMGQQLGSTGCAQPHSITRENVPIKIISELIGGDHVKRLTTTEDDTRRPVHP
jgi:hypothetical protein